LWASKAKRLDHGANVEYNDDVNWLYPG